MPGAPGAGVRFQYIHAAPASTKPIEITCAAVSPPKKRSSFARTNSTRKRSTPASTMYTPKSHPSACLWSRRRHRTRNITSPIAVS
jgi:hypothetical protein